MRRLDNRQRRAARADNDLRFEALSLIARRALVVFSEVRVLLRHGYPIGALARWRTLHEIAILAMFIGQEGPEIAERFLMHQQAEEATEVNDRAEEAIALSGRGATPSEPGAPSPQEVDAARAKLLALKQRYGRSFTDRYGWAAPAVRKGGTGHLGGIVAAVDMEAWRPWVEVAHFAVHAGSASVSWQLGAPEEWDAPASGASNLDLADPGHKAAAGLMFAVMPFLICRLDFDAMIDAWAMIFASGAAQLAFERAGESHQRALEVEAADRRAARRVAGQHSGQKGAAVDSAPG